MNHTAHKIETYQDLFDLPVHNTGGITLGQLITTQPRPASKQALASSTIGMSMETRLKRSGIRVNNATQPRITLGFIRVISQAHLN